MIPTKQQAINILKKHVKEQANIEHNLMVGYGLFGLAKMLKKDVIEQEKWFVTGCLHDIDIEKYGKDIKNHCIVGEKILLKENIDSEIINNIKSHNDALHINRTKQIEHALYSCDGLTGIIRAYILIRPDKNINNVKTKSIKKKIKDKIFAQSVSREKIKLCEKTLNIKLDVFIESVLESIKKNMNFKID